jgi:hypothetical protein
MVRINLPELVVLQALRMAQALRVRLWHATMGTTLHFNPTREKIRLLLACTT